ncbi:putative GTP-binding protein 6 isoform X2 [Eptesicus fuscus]|uniref:putative GTP-binding protein 6 isoform X2 n=1 Tax=Eptesicus fuscus TaxID=29078 RepID=UPI0024045A3F|nr:putative GTP-binding protein 6 isoform X2 [Eptesicus fuscus]
MWTLRAAVRRGAWLSRLVRGRPAPRAAPPPPPPPPWPERALAAFGTGNAGGLQGRGGGSRGPRAHGGTSGAGEEEEEGPEDAEEEEEEEELLRREPLLPSGTQRVCLVHPEIKGGPRRPTLTRAEWQVAEAQALVHTLDHWSVVETMVVPTKTPERKLIFGKGTLEQLTEKIRGLSDVTAVFLNVERLSVPTKEELEAAWRVQVLDRFTVVLHIFRCHARTKEARLQVALAELPLLRSNMRHDLARLDGHGGNSRYIMGSGESFLQVQQRLMKEKETKIRRALERLRQKRQLLGQQRRRREFPVVSVVGYTNCGKTTLIKALTGDSAMEPRDQLFATLDITAHAGSLPSRMTVLYMDTIGFLSELPHSLIESFSATLQDVAQSDVILHVRDVSHPEAELQKRSVLAALRGLGLPAALLDSVLEAHNKVDLVPGYRPAGPRALAVSALRGLGLEELKAELEAAVLSATGRRVLTLRVRLAGPQLSWLHAEATVQDVQVVPEAGVADVTVIISNAAYGRFRKLFPG